MKMTKIIKFLILLLITPIALGIIFLVFWTQVKGWIYYEGFWGNDTPQFVHYVIYNFKHPGFPITSWNYLWHNGAPRVLDATWINFFLTNSMVKAWGAYQTVKIYPLISFGLFVIITYFIFYELSKSVLISLGMGISFVLGQGLYEALFRAGVVMSSISQVFFPLQFYFLARFHCRQSQKNLYLAGIVSALGFYFHGALMMFFGFIPSFIFVLFSTHSGEFFISKKSIKNSIIFTAIVFGIGALGTWPQLLHGFIGGSNSVLIPGPGPRPVIETIRPMIKLTDPGIPIAFIIGLILSLSGFIFKKNKTLLRESIPFAVIFGYVMSWFLSCHFGLNPICGILFPGRSFWAISVTLGALAAFFLSPLSKTIKNQPFSKRILTWLVFNTTKIIIFFLIAANFFVLITGGYFFGRVKAEPILNTTLFNPYDPADFTPGVIKIGALSKEDIPIAATAGAAFMEKIKVEPIPRLDLTEMTKTELQDLYTIVDQKDLNHRVWTHMQGISLVWTRVSDVPLSSGYFHFWTKYSRLWEGWTYAVMSKPNYDSEEIPREMAEKQALFFLDWYGAKYIFFSPGSGEWDLAPYLYENKAYIDPLKSNIKKGYLTIKPELVSGVVSPASSPVVGFVGSDDGYMTFLKDLGALNLNTSYAIPIKLGQSLGDLNSKKLKGVKLLVIYNYTGGGWDKVYQFAKNGGLVWIESGGNVKEREKGNLPKVFPITNTKYGELGEEWEAGGPLAQKLDFKSLEKLTYKNTYWNLSYTLENGVKSGAKVLLTQKGNPIAVSQDIEKGKVLWTGGNFWYRPEEYRQNGMKELKLIDFFLKELLGELSPSRSNAEVVRNKPENIQVKGKDFKGVVFKENKWPGWKANGKWQMENGKWKKAKLPIYTAGPEFMYVSLPNEAIGKETEVTISYKGDPFHWIAFFISIFSFVIVFDFLTFKLIRKLFKFKLIKINFHKNVRKKVSGWWEKDEDDEG